MSTEPLTLDALRALILQMQAANPGAENARWLANRFTDFAACYRHAGHSAFAGLCDQGAAWVKAAYPARFTDKLAEAS